MPKISWGQYEATTDNGGFEKLPAGAYVARIMSAEYKPEKNYAEVVFDIAEGEHAGFYGDEWGKSHPYAHHFFMSYKDSALRMTKGRLLAISESNPGFDALAASDADRFDLFTGRLVGLNLQEEEYRGNDGDVKTRLNVCQVVPVQDVRDGKVQPRSIKKLAAQASVSAATAATVSYEDVPF